MSKLDELRAGVAYVGDTLRDMHESASTEERDFTPDEETRWAEGETYVADALKGIEREERRAAVLEAAETAGHPADGARDFQYQRKVELERVEDVTRLTRGETRDKALALLNSRASDHVSDAGKAQVEAFIRKHNKDHSGVALAQRMLVTENDPYRDAFQKAVSSPSPAFSPEEARAINEARAMSIGTDSAGGFGVPVLIDPSIILTGQESGNPFLQIARVETITNDEWKGVSSAGVSWSFDTEGSAVSDDSPTLAQPNVVAHLARGFVPFSIEVGGDYPGFASEMATLLGAGYDELLVDKFTEGSGTNEPWGIFDALDANTNVEVVVTTDGAFGYEDINKVWKSLPQKYRRNASWLMHVDVNNDVQAMGDDKLRAQTVNLAAGGVDQIKGRPVYESPYAPEFTGTTGAANILVVGDFRNYLIARRLGMTVELVPHLFDVTNNRPTTSRGWLAYARIGGDSVNDLGFRLLQNT